MKISSEQTTLPNENEVIKMKNITAVIQDGPNVEVCEKGATHAFNVGNEDIANRICIEITRKLRPRTEDEQKKKNDKDDKKIEIERIMDILNDDDISEKAKRVVVENLQDNKTLIELASKVVENEKKEKRNEITKVALKAFRDHENKKTNGVIIVQALRQYERELDKMNLQAIDIHDIIKELDCE